MSYHPSFWDDPEKFEFISTVKEVEGEEIILEETFFHPEGGGQPADRGEITDHRVKDVQKVDGKIVHRVPGHELESGSEVRCKIDEEFRRYCMKAHTGAHLVYGAGRKKLGDISYSGFEISENKIRIDFETETHVTRRTLLKMEKMCNEKVVEDREVRTQTVHIDELDQYDDIAFAKEIPDQEEVRVVEIDDWDRATCSGTHLTRTSEVGRIHIMGKKKLQEGVTRIEFCVAEDALKKDYEQKEHLLAAERKLETDDSQLSKKIADILDSREELKVRNEELQERLLGYDLDTLYRFDTPDTTFCIGSVEIEDNDQLSRSVKDKTGPSEVYIVINDLDSTTCVVSVGEDVSHIKAKEVIAEISQEFGGGGGGTADFAQGGGFGADTEEILGYIMGMLDLR